MKGRGLLAWLLLLVSSLTWAEPNALILIQHDRAGPNLPSADSIHSEWIRWPEDQGGGRNNRILALASGVDLQGELADARFETVASGGWRSRNEARLQDRGYFRSRNQHLGTAADKAHLTLNPFGAVSPSVRLIALSKVGETVGAFRLADPMAEDALVLYEAMDWDGVDAVVKRVGGRALIIEYPPDGEDGWSRYWLRGPWPTGVPEEKDDGVSGLIHARQALTLLLHPQRFDWRPDEAGRWGGANRWLMHGRDVVPGLMGGWLALALFLLAWALAQVMNEDRGPLVSRLLELLILSPAALVAGGALSRFGGLESWPVWLPVAWFGLFAFSLLGDLAVRRFAPEVHPLWVPSALGLSTLVLLDPLWSDLSARFAAHEDAVPGVALGAFLAYLTGVAAFAKGRWTGRAAVAVMLLWGLTANPWWIGGHPALLTMPAIVFLVAEGLFRPAMLLFLALLPSGVLRIVQSGAAWNPKDLLAFADEANAVNFYRHAMFLLSPVWIASLCSFAVILLFGNRFLAYRLRKLLRLDPRLRALPWLASATLALGLTEPLALPAVPIVAIAAIVVLSYDGLRANA